MEKRLALITDAWSPQVNGVVQTLHQVQRQLEKLKVTIEVIHPAQFNSMACPTYPEISLALFPRKALLQRLTQFRPHHIHIATEGPLGISAWRLCRKFSWNFTTAFHTQFPEYLHKRFYFPIALTYALLRSFHNQSKGTMVATVTVQNRLKARGLTKILPWSRGVDTDLFQPCERLYLNFPRPIHLYVGRVAVEKNIEAFLALPLKGSKVVVGHGPALASLTKRYADVHFLGLKQGGDLARCYSSADVFVFPSKTDTFGLVMLEAMACGTPVAAYPVQGPLDVLTDPKAGVMNDDLECAIQRALALNREDARKFALKFSWASCAEKFYSNLCPSGICELD